MQDIYQNIMEKVAQETNEPAVLLNELRNAGLYMFTTRIINRDMVETFCAKLIAMYQKLSDN